MATGIRSQYLWSVTDKLTGKSLKQYVGTLAEAKDAVSNAILMLHFPLHFHATIEPPKGKTLAYVPQMRPGYKFTWKRT